MTNLFTDLPDSLLADEQFDELLNTGKLRLERIVSEGHCSPDDFWYDQQENEWVVVLQGEAKLQMAGETEPRHLKPGDYLNIPAHCKHRVSWTTPNQKTVWLALFY